VNGILQRTDWEEAIKMPIGIVPAGTDDSSSVRYQYKKKLGNTQTNSGIAIYAGTGNGMAKSLLHAANQTCSISDALFAIIRGHKQALDVCTLVQGQKRIFSVLSITWGTY
jgi:sphingosine kinase